MSGKGMMVWNIQRCGWGTDVDALLDALEAAKVKRVEVKILDGSSETWNALYILPWQQNKALLPQFVNGCRMRGISPWGWGYTYGGTDGNAIAEANKAVAMVQQYDLDGWVINAEHQYKVLAAKTWAPAHTKALKAGLPNKPIGLCSYRYPNLHPEFPWLEFLNNGVTHHMPQVYWLGSTNSAAQLVESHKQLMARKALPFLPVGAAYKEHGMEATGAQMIAFAEQAKTMKLPGISFWSLEHAKMSADRWSAFQQITFPDPTTPAPPQPTPSPPSTVSPPSVIKLKALMDFNMRSEPSAAKGSLTVIGGIKKDDVFTLEGLHVENAARVWARVGLGKWCAIVHDNKKYMERVD